MDSLKGKLTKEEAQELVNSGLVDDPTGALYRWKKNGYIKKSELEEARERFKKYAEGEYQVSEKYAEALYYIKDLEIEVSKLYSELEELD